MYSLNSFRVSYVRASILACELVACWLIRSVTLNTSLSVVPFTLVTQPNIKLRSSGVTSLRLRCIFIRFPTGYFYELCDNNGFAKITVFEGYLPVYDLLDNSLRFPKTVLRHQPTTLYLIICSCTPNASDISQLHIHLYELHWLQYKGNLAGSLYDTSALGTEMTPPTGCVKDQQTALGCQAARPILALDPKHINALRSFIRLNYHAR